MVLPRCKTVVSTDSLVNHQSMGGMPGWSNGRPMGYQMEWVVVINPMQVWVNPMQDPSRPPGM